MIFKILVVDDTEEMHDLFTALLESINEDILGGSHKEGFELQIDHCFQGEEAVNKMLESKKENTPYALVYMDINMPPGIDGIEAVKQIRTTLPDTNFVFCTGYTHYTWKSIYDAFGRNDRILYLDKPFCDLSIKQLTTYLLTRFEHESTLNSNKKAS